MPVLARGRRNGSTTSTRHTEFHRAAGDAWRIPRSAAGPYAALTAVLNFLYPQLPPRQGLVQVIEQLEGQIATGKACAAALVALQVPVAAVTALCNAASALGLDIVSYLRRTL